MPAETLRLFIAVPAPPAVRAAAEAVIADLRGAEDVRWVTPERLHLTLKFLGDTPAEKLPDLQEALEKTSNKYSSFVVELGDVGAFPNPRKPQTLWLGIGEDAGALARLAGAVDEAVHPLGFSREERPFRPHLTLGRVKSPRGLGDLAHRLREKASETHEKIAWPVDELQLIRSVLRPTGPDYTPLNRFPLRSQE